MPHAVKKLLLLPAALLALLWGCEQYDFAPDSSAALHFSADTLSFDTIFSPIGSTTFTCKVYNRGNKNLVIDEVFLAKRSTSPFLMNVDGRAGYSVRNVRLAKKDSLHIFLEVQKNQELLLTDQVVFVSGGTEHAERIQLAAYGQEVVLFDRDTVLRADCDFTPDKPYLINANVTVDSGVTATVKASAKLYFGKNCGITVNGTLRAEGLASSPCIFAHPRYKEAWYSNAGGQWEGITVNASGSATLTYAQLHGARQAFYVLDTLDEVSVNLPQLRLSRCKITSSEVGIKACMGITHIDNCLIVNSLSGALLLQGGMHQVYHCTMATYATPQDYHSAQVALQNFRVGGARDTLSAPLLAAHFFNSIVYGSNNNELSVKQRAGTDMSFLFESCLVKSKPNSGFSNVKNSDPKFRNVSKNDFHLVEGSPAIDAGQREVAYLPDNRLDLEGFDRVTEQDSSMGCYAYREPK